MEDVFMLNIYGRQLADVIRVLGEKYRSLGVKIQVVGSDPNNQAVTFEKDMGGAAQSFGLGQSVTANFTVYGDTMTVKMETGDWTRKKLLLIFGPLLWAIPDITTLIGISRQNKLKEQIKLDIYQICNST